MLNSPKDRADSSKDRTRIRLKVLTRLTLMTHWLQTHDSKPTCHMLRLLRDMVNSNDLFCQRRTAHGGPRFQPTITQISASPAFPTWGTLCRLLSPNRTKRAGQVRASRAGCFPVWERERHLRVSHTDAEALWRPNGTHAIHSRDSSKRSCLTLSKFWLWFYSRVKSKETVGNSWTVLSYFGSQISSQSLNEIHIYRLQPKSATKGDFFSYIIFCLCMIVSSRTVTDCKWRTKPTKCC